MYGHKTFALQRTVESEMIAKARQIKQELSGFLEDVELFANPAFWKAVRHVEEGKITKYKSIPDLRRRLGL